MAPEKNKAKVIKKSNMEITLWTNCSKSETVPDNYVSIVRAERMFGVKYKVCKILLNANPALILFLQDLTAEELTSVIYSRRGGQYGYFLPPKVHVYIFF